MRQLVVCLSLVCVVAWVCAGERPRYIGCESSDECGKGACCVIGMGRFSVPQCKGYQDLEDICRPNTPSVNLSLVYPDKVRVNLTDVYYLFCPCLSGLTCQRDEATNDAPRCTTSVLENHLADVDDDDDDYYY